MRFVTLVSLAVVVSSTPGLAAPAPYTRNRPNSKRDDTFAHNIEKWNATDFPWTNTISPIEVPDLTDLTVTRKRDIITTVLQALLEEAGPLLGNLKRASDDYQGLLQELESLGVSTQRRSVELPEKPDSTFHIDERAFKIPASVTTWLKNLGNIASIGAGGAAIVGAVDGSSNSTILKRQAPNGVDLAALLNGAASQFDERTVPKISSSEIPSSSAVSGWESAIEKVAGVASAGGFAASLLSAFEGSSNSTKREWTAINGTGPDSLPIVETIPQFDRFPASPGINVDGTGGPAFSTSLKQGASDVVDLTETSHFDERAFTIPASVTTWLKNLGNIASIGAGGAAIVGAVDGSSNNTFLKREASDAVDLTQLLNGAISQFDERSFTIPASVTTWLKNLGNIASIGAGGAAIVGAVDGSSNSTFLKREASDVVDLTQLLNGAASQFDERSFTIPASVTTWLKDLGNIASIGAGGAAIVGAVDGSSNSTFLKREPSDEVDFAGLLNGATSQFNERTIPKISSSEIPSSSEVSGWESALEKAAGVASAGGFVASLLSAFEGSSTSASAPPPASSSASAKRSTSDNGIVDLTQIITPEQLQQIMAQLNTRMVDLD